MGTPAQVGGRVHSQREESRVAQEGTYMGEELEERRGARAVTPLGCGVGFCSADLHVYGGERAGV